MSDRIPGQAPYSAIVEGAAAWGDVRTNRREDAKWRGVAGRLLDAASPRGVGYIYLRVQPSDTNIVTVNGVVFEFDSNATFTAGRTRVVIGGSLAVTVASLVAAINASSANVDAVALTAGTGGQLSVACISRGTRGDQSNLALSATLTDAPDSFAVSMIGGDTASAYREGRGIYEVRASDVLATNGPSELEAGFPVGAVNFSEQPDHLMLRCVNAAGAEKSLAGIRFSWVQANGNHWVLQCRDAATAVLAAGDVIHWSTCVF